VAARGDLHAELHRLSRLGEWQTMADHPDQLARLQDEPGLMPSAVEEMIRWTTPVKEFMRTAQRECVIRGVRIPAGDSVLLTYVSGNRDEEVCRCEPFRERPHLHALHGVSPCRRGRSPKERQQQRAAGLASAAAWR
jgi:hypothetical protein